MTNRLLNLLIWILILLGLAVLTATETLTLGVYAGLAALLAALALQAVKARRRLARTGLELAWVLGLASGAAAVWIAYDRPAAILQYIRLLAALVLFYAVVGLPERKLRWPSAGLLLLAAGLALYWPAANDFAAQPGKLALITRLGLAINRVVPALPGPEIHPNVAAGALLIGVPFGIALAWEAWQRKERLWALAAAGLTLVVLGGLLMTSSRGAWLALLGTGLAAGLAWAQRRWLRGGARQAIFWGVIGLVSVLVVGGVIASGSFDRLVGSLPDPNGGIQSRADLWQQGWQAALQYPFTGSGLMSFWRVHPIYVLLINVPFIAHSHNTFLEVWVEQGVVGFLGLALAGLVVAGWAWSALGRKQVSIWGWAGLAALTAAALHGMVDVVFYVTRTLPLIGLLFGFASFARAPLAPAGAAPVKKTGMMLAAGLGGVVLLAALLFWRPLRAAWYANLGAVLQTRQELTVYDPLKFDTVSLDQVRQNIDLSEALAAYEQALAIDPSNGIARQRRAQIALSRGEYPAALEDASYLWQAGRLDEITRLTYGDALAANGQPEQAAEAVRGVPWAEARLQGQAWYRYWLGQDYQRAADAWSAVLLLNPDIPGVEGWLEQARSKLK
jgi:O-antigen ligase